MTQYYLAELDQWFETINELVEANRALKTLTPEQERANSRSDEAREQMKALWQDLEIRQEKLERLEPLRQGSVGREKTQEEKDKIHATRKEKTLLAREAGIAYGDDKKKGKPFIDFTDEIKGRIAATREQNQAEAEAQGVPYGSEKNRGRPNTGVSKALKGKKKSPEAVAQQQATKAQKRAEMEAQGIPYGPGKNKGKKKAPTSAATRERQSLARKAYFARIRAEREAAAQALTSDGSVS